MNRVGKSSMCTDMAVCRRAALPVYAERGRLLVQDCADLGGSVPVGVAGADHCGTVHDRQNVDFAVDVFVDDAIGKAVGLAKALEVGGNREETFCRNGIAEFGEVGQMGDGICYLAVPTGCVLARKFAGDCSENGGPLLLGVLGPLVPHLHSPFACISSSMSSISLKTSSSDWHSPFSNCLREMATERESSIRSIKSSKSPALMMYEAARPFCVTRTGRCVWLTLAMMAEKLLRHSENGMVSSEGRQCLMGSSAVIGIVEIPFNGRYCTKSCADRQCGFKVDFKEVA